MNELLEAKIIWCMVGFIIGFLVSKILDEIKSNL